MRKPADFENPKKEAVYAAIKYIRREKECGDTAGAWTMLIETTGSPEAAREFLAWVRENA